MSLVNLSEILTPARKNGYAVGAFNILNADFVSAVISAAEKQRMPVILNIAEVHYPYIDLKEVCDFVVSKGKKSPVPVCFNLDHGLSMDSIEQAVKLGFTSVMFDGSHLATEENIRISAEAVKLCHPLRIGVEAELGAVGGSEDGSVISEANPELFTNPEQARDFVERTGIDALAVAVGNTHGHYKGDPKLDFERIEKISAKARIPLVLHGGSGISPDGFKKAIHCGISKINFFTGMAKNAMDSIIKGLSENEGQYNALPAILQDMRNQIEKAVSEQIEIFSCDK